MDRTLKERRADWEDAARLAIEAAESRTDRAREVLRQAEADEARVKQLVADRWLRP
jgi:predicted O-methyltransferase YrrM